MAATGFSIQRFFSETGKKTLSLAAIQTWAVGIGNKIYNEVSFFYGKAVDNVASLLSAAKSSSAAPLLNPIFDTFRVAEALFSFILTRIIDLIFYLINLATGFSLDKKYYNIIIVGITMLILTYQFSTTRYAELIHIKNLKAIEEARRERERLENSAKAKKATSTIIGGGVGLLLTLGNPIGGALGALVGSMFSDTTPNRESHFVAISSKTDGKLAVKATLKGILSAIVYSLLLLAILSVPSQNNNQKPEQNAEIVSER